MEWIPEKNSPPSCTLSSGQLQSHPRHPWCPIRPRSIEASSFPRLQTIAPWPARFSKSYPDHHHNAEWFVFQTMKLSKTPGQSVEKSSITSQGWGDLIPTSVVRQVCLQLQGGHKLKLACPALPRSLLSSRHGLFSRKLVF